MGIDWEGIYGDGTDLADNVRKRADTEDREDRRIKGRR